MGFTQPSDNSSSESCTHTFGVPTLCCSVHKTKGRGQGTRLTGHNTFIKPFSLPPLFACQHHSLLHHKYEAPFNVRLLSQHAALLTSASSLFQDHHHKIIQANYVNINIREIDYSDISATTTTYPTNERTSSTSLPKRKRERYLKRNP